MAGVAPRDDRGPIAPSGPDRAPIAPSGPDRALHRRSGPDCAVRPRSGPDCAVGPKLASPSFAFDTACQGSPALSYSRVAPRDDRGPIAPSGPDRVLIAPSGPDRAPIAPSGPDQGEIALSLVALLYKAASSATPAVRMVPGRSARILGVICSLVPQQLKGSTRVPPGFHQGSTRVPPGFHMLLGISPELILGVFFGKGGLERVIPL